MTKHLFIIFLFIFIFPVFLFSQPTGNGQTRPKGNDNPQQNMTYSGTITGSIINVNQQAVEYANIILHRLPDSLVVGITYSDDKGSFSFENLPYGKYYLEINHLSYTKQQTPVFELTAAKTVYRLNKYKLEQQVNELQGIEVKAKKDMLQSNLDKKVFNVESNINAEGATAVEILQDIPSVSVDLEGNVSMRGSDNVTILIDGRPTSLALEQIPADQIEAIEVITNPSARLEPDGQAGILNVVLKKRKEAGFNGLITLGSALNVFQKKVFVQNYNGNINLNYSYDKINIFLNYSYRNFGRRGAGTMDRLSWFDADSSFLYQDNENRNSGAFHNLRAGLDYFINKKNTLSFVFGYNHNQFKMNSSLYSDNSYIIDNDTLPYIVYNQSSENQNSGNNFNGSFSYKKTFDVKGRELYVDLYYAQMNRDALSSTQRFFLVPDNMPYFQKTKTLDLNRNATMQIDFVTPVGNGGRIETGYKFSLRNVGQDYMLQDGYAHEYDSINHSYSTNLQIKQTNNFLYSEYINAAYFIYSNTFWKRLKVQVGLRLEQAQTVSELLSADTTIKRSYFHPFPTAHLVFDISKEHSLQLSYSRRVSRPRIQQLNPFEDISDNMNIRKGNPELTPELVHSFELGYLMMIKKSSFNLTAFYRQREDIITRYTQLLQGIDDEGNDYTYTLTSYENLSKSQNFGFEAVYGQRVGKIWMFNINADFYRIIFKASQLIDENLKNDWAYGFRVNQTFSMPKDWEMQLNFRFRSASLTLGSMGWDNSGTGQGKRSADYSLGLALKKSFLKKNLSVNLNIRNLIYRKATTIHTYSMNPENGYDSNSIRYNSAFQVNLSVTYKINNFKRRTERISTDSEEDIIE
jgi:outer membrane receptor protein involved in Fe transport